MPILKRSSSETAREGKVEAMGRLKEAARALRRDLGHLRVDQVRQAQWEKYAANRMTRPHRKADPCWPES
jgi:hypothetical protein